MAGRLVAPVPVPAELRAVPRGVLEDYVLHRIKQFSRCFAGQLLPTVSEQHAEQAFANTMALLKQDEAPESENCMIHFKHKCRFLGCMQKSCILCKNNPNKRCKENDNFDECYADNQVLRAKCEADVHLELINPITGATQSVAGMELLLSVVDGDSWNEATPTVFNSVRELLKSDEGQQLMSCQVSGQRFDPAGRLLLRLQDGSVRLPDVTITDKNDTFHLNGGSFSSFRLLARAVKRDLFGNIVPVDSIPPAVSGKFVVKTQRALNDYRKSEYPHYKDELTKLKFIGSITAQRLRDIQSHLGYDVPFTSIETVEQLKHLMLYADQNRQVENKLLDLLNMKGKHKHKWDYLREILSEKIVYDDMVHRAWYADEGLTQGLLFACKQAQVNLDKPVGIVRRMIQGGQGLLQVFTGQDAQSAETMRAWKAVAEQAWVTAGHPGWNVVQERMELLNTGAGSAAIPLAGSAPAGSLQTSLSSGLPHAMSGGTDPMDESQGGMYVRSASGVTSPHAQASAIKPESPTMARRQSTSMGVGAMGMMVMGSGGSGTGVGLAQATGLQGRASHQAMDFQFSAPLGGGPGGAMPDPFRVAAQPLDPLQQTVHNAQGPFQFGAGPRGSGALVTSGMAGQPSGAASAQLEGPDVYRTASAPTMQAMLQMMQQASHSVVGPGELEHPLRGRSGRFRRMSAPTDNAEAQLAAQQLPVPARPIPASAFFDPSLDLSFNKRPRASAPSGLYPDVVTLANAEAAGNGAGRFGASGGQPVDRMAFERTRLGLYHQESRGRHLPRTRTSQENLSAPSSPISHVFQDAGNELDRLLENMHPLEAPSFALRGGVGLNLDSERNSPADQVLMNMRHMSGSLPHLTLLSQPINLAPGPDQGPVQQHPGSEQQQQQRLSGLHLADQAGGEGGAGSSAAAGGAHAGGSGGHGTGAGMSVAAAAAAAVAAADVRQLLYQESDSFNRTIERVLKHSDSDSFKRLLGMPLGSPGNHPDPGLAGLDKALEDLLGHGAGAAMGGQGPM